MNRSSLSGRRHGLFWLIGLFLAGCVTPLTPQSAESPPILPPSLQSDLVAYYPLDGGDAEDATAYENHGTVTGAVATADRLGNNAGALRFDGVNDSVTIEHNAAIGVTFAASVSVWLRYEAPADPAAYYTVLEKGDPERGGHARWGVWLIGDRAEFCIQPASGAAQHCLDSAAPLVAGAWHHLVGTWDGATLRLYVDGVVSAEKTHPTDGIASSSFPLFLGADPYSDPTVYLKGSLDELRIYRRALSAEEVSILYGDSK